MIKKIYNICQPYLPDKIQMINGVGVRKGGVLDRNDVFHDYEEVLVSHIRENVNSGDNVVVVGGGIGVSSVVAARQSKPDGSVTVYEASVEQFDILVETIEINNMFDAINPHHAAVGEPKELLGEPGDFEMVSPEALPSAEVFVFDCEGSELDILKQSNLPETVIVETHGELGSPSKDVKSVLEQTHQKVREDVMKPDEDVVVITYER